MSLKDFSEEMIMTDAETSNKKNQAEFETDECEQCEQFKDDYYFCLSCGKFFG